MKIVYAILTGGELVLAPAEIRKEVTERTAHIRVSPVGRKPFTVTNAPFSEQPEEGHYSPAPAAEEPEAKAKPSRKQPPKEEAPST